MGQLELLWAAAALMLLGAIVSLCVKCQLSATKRKKQQSERRSQFESQHGFEVIRSHSTTTRRLEQIKEPENLSIAREVSRMLLLTQSLLWFVTPGTVCSDLGLLLPFFSSRNITKELGASRHAGYALQPCPPALSKALSGSRAADAAAFGGSVIKCLLSLSLSLTWPSAFPQGAGPSPEDCLRGDTAYVEPIALDYYNHARFFTPPNEKEEDSHSYQNVIIGVSHSCDLVTDDSADYENSAAIHIWKLQQAEALQTESLDDEPDYINTAPVSDPVPLSKRSILHKV
ncbi:linker for activation of T-cells family member 2 isoform X1 [Columba livia]|uniref:linker for activation of T-cells family member 2 isoform X1 n=1 Tax=Columba livia TaxID=8932 RepID=UPI0031BAF4E0